MRLRSTTDKNRRPKVPSPSAREPEFLRSLPLGSMRPDIISYVTDATAVQEWYGNYLLVSDRAVDVMSHTIIEWGLP
jgi:hypothetical protein